MKNIPKIAHFYWDSPTGLSFLRAMTVVSFHKFNPDWKIKIHRSIKTSDKITWNSREHQVAIESNDNYGLLEGIPIKWVEHNFDEYAFSNEHSEVHKSDYLRWILLYKEGGLWSDFDILYFNSLNKLSLKKYFDSAICVYPTGHHAIGFLMGAKGSKLWRRVHKDARKKFNPTGYQSIGSDILNSYDRDAFKKSTLLPTEAVYPLNINRPDDFWVNPIDIAAIDGAIGVHWYAGHAMSNEWDNKLKENTYQSFDNSICHLLKTRILTDEN